MTATPYSLCFKSHLSPLLEANIQTILFLMPWESTEEEERGDGGGGGGGGGEVMVGGLGE